jgi:hypothetical protein
MLMIILKTMPSIVQGCPNHGCFNALVVMMFSAPVGYSNISLMVVVMVIMFPLPNNDPNPAAIPAAIPPILPPAAGPGG